MGSCLGYADGGLPLAPILSAVESSEQTRQGWAGAAVPGGERAAPGITDLITGGDSGGPPAGGDWARVYGRLAAAFTRAGTERPVLLMIDDLQWADHSTLEFLDYLASRSDRQRLALVATYRDDDLRRADVGRWLGEMIRSRGAIDLHLDLLGSNDCQVMVRQMTDHPVDPGFGSEVFRRSGGNPYLIELLARSGASTGTTLPAGLTQALLVRWRALPQRSTDILTLLAVLSDAAMGWDRRCCRDRGFGQGRGSAAGDPGRRAER